MSGEHIILIKNSVWGLSAYLKVGEKLTEPTRKVVFPYLKHAFWQLNKEIK